jgi:hypothetical protein
MFCINCGKALPSNSINFCPNCGFALSKDLEPPVQILNYVAERLEKQIKWHSKKSRQNKLKFRFYEIITIISSASIPIFNLIDFGDLATRIITSLIGGTIAVVTGLTQLEKYQENWILYRTSAELLKKEKWYYENDVGEFANLNNIEKNKMLVERVESIVSSETSKYFVIHQPNKKDNQKETTNTENS